MSIGDSDGRQRRSWIANAASEPGQSVSNKIESHVEELRVSSILCKIDDKHVPLYRIMWVASVPHFCGHEDCQYEGRYEVRLEQDESLWANRKERDEVISAIEAWHGGPSEEEQGDDWP